MTEILHKINAVCEVHALQASESKTSAMATNLNLIL